MRAKPIVALGLVAGALAIPGAACALGLGKLTVESSIGQPLVAQIQVMSATSEELDSLTARVADPSLYRQNNFTYNSALARARVTVDKKPNGQATIRVVTPGAVNEPFLDLMIEVNWASGRLVREYTFLLDPPGVQPTPVEPTAPLRVGAGAPRAPAAAAAPAAAPASPTGGVAAGAGDQYRVRRGDTLSKIANEFKAPNATLEQMLVALYNANQAAFDGGNINRLRAGSIVSIPDAQVVAATSAPDAASIVRMHASDWRAYRDRVAATAPTSEAPAARSAGGRIGVASVETTPAVPPGRDQLKVSRDAGGGKVGGATEEMVARERQIREAQTRIAELEKTLTELQRAVELKNQTMAQLQAQAEAAKGAPKVAEPAKAAEPKVAEAAKTEPPKAEPAPAAAAAVATPAPATAPAPAVDATKPAEAPKAETAKAAPKAPPPAAPPPPSFVDELMASTPTWAIGAAALAVLGGLAVILASRRRKAAKEDEGGIIGDTDIKTNTVFGSTGGGVVNTGENSLSNEFSREGLASIDNDEVDPIAEAEVYLAYGRDAQAEEILKHALRKDPQRQEIYLKLLEIHAQHNKPSAFETVAAELYAISHGQGETWLKAVALGRQLDPANPMFAPAGSSFGEPTTPPGGIDRAAVAAPSVAPSPFDAKLDEDLALAATARDVKPKSPADILAGAQSEVEKSTRGLAAAKPAEAAPLKPELARARNDLDFTLDELSPPKPAAESIHGPAAFDLDKLDLSFEKVDTVQGEGTPSVLDGQWHDAATKLDLAKAYQEMGDVEGAREILQEVLREGDGGQKAEAQALLGKLG